MRRNAKKILLALCAAPVLFQFGCNLEMLHRLGVHVSELIQLAGALSQLGLAAAPT